VLAAINGLVSAILVNTLHTLSNAVAHSAHAPTAPKIWVAIARKSQDAKRAVIKTGKESAKDAAANVMLAKITLVDAQSARALHS